jgi:hypothetical protein
LSNFSLLFAADVSGVSLKISCKSSQKLVNQKYATLFLSWMPFNSFYHYDYLHLSTIDGAAKYFVFLNADVGNITLK